jgi:Ring finger domain
MQAQLASWRSFARRNFGYNDAPTSDDEDESVEPSRRTIFRRIELYLGSYFPLVMYLSILLALFFGAVALTAMYGDGTNLVQQTPGNSSPDLPSTSANSFQEVKGTPSKTSGPVTVFDPSTSSGPGKAFDNATSSIPVANGNASQPLNVPTGANLRPAGPIQQTLDNRVAALSLFLAMSAFSIMTTVLALRLMQRARALSAANGTGGGRSRSALVTQFLMLNRGGVAMNPRLRLALMNRDFDGDDYEMLNQLDEDNDRGGASEGDINRLPLHTLTQEYVSAQTTDALRCCSICLAPYESGDVVRTILCMHQFHKDCIDRWLRTNATCPVCKCAATSR